MGKRIPIESLYAASSRGKANPPPIIEGEFERVDPAIKREPETSLATPSIPPQPKLPFGPLRKIKPKELHTRRDLMEQLNATLPLNDSDLPSFVYRPDLLDVEQFKQLGSDSSPEEVSSIQSALEAATVPLKFYEGYPCLANGLPFWSQLDFEPYDAHQAFLAYQQLGGARALEDLATYGIEFNLLLDWFHLYFWNFRVTSFDMFKVVRHQRIKLLRALNVEDDHFLLSEQIMTQLKAYFKNPEQFDITKLDAKDAVMILEKVTKLQRISAGLGEKGGFSDEVEPPRMQPVEVIMRQIVGPKGDGDPREEREEFDVLTESPENVDLAQELIIRMNQPQK